MDIKTKNKIDLLVGLAAVDNNFHTLEKRIINEVLQHYNAENYVIKPVFDNFKLLHEADQLDDKEELLYLALRIILADQNKHSDEIAFVKVLALKLGFRPEIVDYISNNGLSSFEEFKSILSGYVK